MCTHGSAWITCNLQLYTVALITVSGTHYESNRLDNSTKQ